jgi:Flp pilus assembly protein TadD
MARLVYGNLLERAGEFQQALEQFEHAARLDPTNAGPVYQAIRCARKLRNESKSKSLLARYRAVIATYGPGN